MKKVLSFILIIIILLGIGIGGYFAYNTYFKNGKFNKYLPTLNTKTKDIKNGIYISREYYNKSVYIYENCNVSSYDDYIVVLGNKYRRYQGNCMVMRYLGEQDNNLNFKKDDNDNYYIELEGIKFKKDSSIKNIKVGNGIIENLIRTKFTNLGFIVKNSEREGNYFNFETEVSGFGFKTHFKFNKDQYSNKFTIELGGSGDRYRKDLYSLDDFPTLNSYNGKIVIIEKNKVGEGIQSTLRFYDNEKEVFNSKKILPIKINDIYINESWYSYFRYDSASKKYYVIYSLYPQFCKDGDDVSFYEFKLDYDYKTGSIKNTEFVKKGKGQEGCNYVQKYYLKG